MDLHVLTHSFPTRRSSDLDVARLTRELFLPPHRRDGARDREEVGRRREQHLALERIVPKLVVLIERGGEEMLAGDEHHDEIGRVVELIPIVFGTEHVDVRAHRRRVRGEMRDLPIGRAWRRERVGQYVEISGVAVPLNKKKTKNNKKT